MGISMKYKYIAAAALLLFLCLALGYSILFNSVSKEPKTPAASSNQKSIAVITTYNSKHELEEETFETVPKRVIAIWQGSIEIMLALGVGDRIIAATGIPDPKFLRPELRESYAKIPYHSFDPLDKESALVMNPDFIITSWESAFSEKRMGTTDFWQSRKVKTYISEIPVIKPRKRTLEHEYKVIQDLGKLFQVEDKADSIVTSIRKRLTDLQEQASREKDKPSVMIVQYMSNKLVNWGDDYLQADMVKKLGGRLLLHTKGYITEEEILKQKPDVIFLMVTEWDYDKKENLRSQLLHTPSLNSLPCIQKERVYILPLYEGQYSGVRTAEGLEHVAKGLYPDIQ